jgi:hypothetical protein
MRTIKEVPCAKRFRGYDTAPFSREPLNSLLRIDMEASLSDRVNLSEWTGRLSVGLPDCDDWQIFFWSQFSGL